MSINILLLMFIRVQKIDACGNAIPFSLLRRDCYRIVERRHESKKNKQKFTIPFIFGIEVAVVIIFLSLHFVHNGKEKWPIQNPIRQHVNI